MQKLPPQIIRGQRAIPTQVKFELLKFYEVTNESLPRIGLQECEAHSLCLPIHHAERIQLFSLAGGYWGSEVVEITAFVVSGQSCRFESQPSAALRKSFRA
jgi:hypothetical protein